MGKVPGYKVRIRGSRRELVWKGDEEDEEDLGMLEDRTGPPDMRIRASRRELVWGADGENDEVEEKEEDEEGARRKEEDLYYGGQKIKHFKSKDELPNSRVSPLIIFEPKNGQQTHYIAQNRQQITPPPKKKQHLSFGKFFFTRLQECSVRPVGWDSQRQEGRQQEKRVRVEVQKLVVVVEAQAGTL